MSYKSLGRVFFFLGVFLLSPNIVRSQEISQTYLCEFFGFRGKIFNLAATSHSFVRCWIQTSDQNIIHNFTISWIPEDPYLRRGLRMPAFGDVPGQNLSLSETLSRAQEHHRLVVSLGTFEMRPEAYWALWKQSCQLDQKEFSYRGIDRFHRETSANCRNAIRGAFGLQDVAPYRGPGATGKILRDFSREGYVEGQVFPGYQIQPPRRSLLRRH